MLPKCPPPPPPPKLLLVGVPVASKAADGKPSRIARMIRNLSWAHIPVHNGLVTIFGGIEPFETGVNFTVRRDVTLNCGARDHSPVQRRC